MNQSIIAATALAFAASACCTNPVSEGGGSTGGSSAGSGTSGGGSSGAGSTGTGGGSTGGSSGSGGSSTGGSSAGSGSSGGSSSGGSCAAVGEGCEGPLGPPGCCAGLTCQANGIDTAICRVICQSDADCTATGGYCVMPLDACPGAAAPLVTTAPGFCHRDCQNSACVCRDAADCPQSAAAGNANACGADGQCADYGVLCSNVTCPAECPLAGPIESLCPVCICQSCPGLDGGAGGADGGAAGAACGLAPDAGACGPNQVCCESWGGVYRADGGPGPFAEGCHDLGPDGGCPAGGALCTFDDGGAITSCNFDYP